MKILLAIDVWHGSEVAIQQIIARLCPSGSELKIIAVVELLT